MRKCWLLEGKIYHAYIPICVHVAGVKTTADVSVTAWLAVLAGSSQGFWGNGKLFEVHGCWHFLRDWSLPSCAVQDASHAPMALS